jgi:hypothetical protein
MLPTEYAKIMNPDAVTLTFTFMLVNSNVMCPLATIAFVLTSKGLLLGQGQ